MWLARAPFEIAPSAQRGAAGRGVNCRPHPPAQKLRAEPKVRTLALPLTSPSHALPSSADLETLRCLKYPQIILLPCDASLGRPVLHGLKAGRASLESRRQDGRDPKSQDLECAEEATRHSLFTSFKLRWELLGSTLAIGWDIQTRAFLAAYGVGLKVHIGLLASVGFRMS